MTGRPQKRTVRLWVAVGVAIAVAAIVAFLLLRSPETEPIRIDEFFELVDDGTVVSATVSGDERLVSGKLADGEKYRVIIPRAFSAELTERLSDADPPIELDAAQLPSTLVEDLVITILPLILLVGAFGFLLNRYQAGGKAATFSKTAAKRSGKGARVTFDDVAGADEAVEELREVTEFLRDPSRFRNLGAKIPKGVLLYGPPGTGKTLLARAVAGEADAQFFSISGSDFVEMFVGVGASRVRDLFKQASELAPAIVFVDEIDAVGRQRGAGLGGGHDEREQTLNQLLVEMDGFDNRSGVIVLAATNRPDILDPALLRPGRFDRQVAVAAPDRRGREAILAVHAAGKPLGDDVRLDVIAGRTPGFSGADLANVLNEAAILAARYHRTSITGSDVEEAVERVLAGPARQVSLLSAAERKIVAYHEAGHALVGHALPDTDPVEKVSIVARGQALGYTLAIPLADKHLRSRAELFQRMAMLLGGRTAEELVFGEVTTGAADDIAKVTDLARLMVTEYGMSNRLGPRKLGHSAAQPFLGKEMGHEPDYSAAVAAVVDEEIDDLVARARGLAWRVINHNRNALDRLANKLLEDESVSSEGLGAILGEVVPVRSDHVAAASNLPRRSLMVAPPNGNGHQPLAEAAGPVSRLVMSSDADAVSTATIAPDGSQG